MISLGAKNLIALLFEPKASHSEVEDERRFFFV